MFGLSYFRELKMRQEQGQELDLSDDCFAENISQDMLNRIFFKKFTDILLPHRQVSVGSFTYDREAGYSFDRQLVANLPEFRDRRLGDYQVPEYQGIIPTVILTPTILNQGRQLYVSASPVSFLARPNQVSEHYFAKGCGIEFRRFYKDQQPDSLLMSTALRMNATFPFILPVVRLPSKPVMEVMDAGAIDNYGTQTCIRYLFEFREWFEENTAGILVVQIRDNDRQDPIRASSDEKGGYGIFQPLGGGYYSMTESRDMSNDYMLAFMQEWFHGKVEVLTFEYPRETSDQPASLSWHLTRREKQKILASMGTAHNQNSLAALRRMYEVPYPAIKAPLHLSSR
jgi:hypothetical protein